MDHQAPQALGRALGAEALRQLQAEHTMQLRQGGGGVEAEHQVRRQARGVGIGVEQPIDQGLQLAAQRHEGMVAALQDGAAAGHEHLPAAQDQCHQHAIGQGELPQRHADHERAGAHGVVDDLAIHLPQGVDLHRQRRGGIGRAADAQPAGHQRQRPALGERREQHHEEHRIEDLGALGHPGQQREGGQGDRHRSLEAHPGEEAELAAAEAERPHRRPDGDRPSHQDQHQGDQQPLPGHRQQAAGEAEQTEHHEQHDLPQPGGGVVEGEDAPTEDERTAAEHDAREVHGQEAAAAQHRRQPERHQSEGQGEQGIEPGGVEVDAVDRGGGHPSHQQPRQAADAELADEQPEQLRR